MECPVVLVPKHFNPNKKSPEGSIGFNGSGKITLPMGEDGEFVTFQVSLNIMAVNSGRPEPVKSGDPAGMSTERRKELLAKIRATRCTAVFTVS